jgi:hypothetical protein
MRPASDKAEGKEFSRQDAKPAKVQTAPRIHGGEKRTSRNARPGRFPEKNNGLIWFDLV